MVLFQAAGHGWRRCEIAWIVMRRIRFHACRRNSVSLDLTMLFSADMEPGPTIKRWGQWFKSRNFAFCKVPSKKWEHIWNDWKRWIMTHDGWYQEFGSPGCLHLNDCRSYKHIVYIYMWCPIHTWRKTCTFTNFEEAPDYGNTGLTVGLCIPCFGKIAFRCFCEQPV